MKTIGIIGSTGTNARPWTEAFLAAGWQVRSLVRQPQQIAPRERLSAVAFDFDDPQSYEPALAGADVLALISPAQPKQVHWERDLIAAARRAGVSGIIKLSVIGADMPEPISFFARNAAESEKALRASGVPHIVLRSNGFHAERAAPAGCDRGRQPGRALRGRGGEPHRRARCRRRRSRRRERAF
jgi:NAD(P)H dehydrogenase (quinone)